MSRKTFKRGGHTSFVMLGHWFLDTAAWQSLKPGPRALYLELKRKYNGNNNGKIFLSHRDAAQHLNVGRDTVAGYFETLTELGFIIQTRGHCLGPSGQGQAASYALAECPLHGQPATKAFTVWEKQKPSRKIRHSLAGKSDHLCRKTRHSTVQMSENPATSGPKQHSTVSESPAIYTSSHIPPAKTRVAEVTKLVARGSKPRTSQKPAGPSPASLLSIPTMNKTLARLCVENGNGLCGKAKVAI